MKIYDISIPIRPGMPVWPGDPAVVLQQISSLSSGDSANITHMSICVHTGTHIDAPKHFVESGKTINQIPLEKLTGEVLVMRIDKSTTVISDRVLKSHPWNALLRETSKVLFRTSNSSLWRDHPDTFQQDFVGIDTSGALYLEQLELDLIGIDYLSIAPYADTTQPHQILLSAGTVLLEGVDLSKVPGGVYDIFCLPINILGCEGAPARAILVDYSA